MRWNTSFSQYLRNDIIFYHKAIIYFVIRPIFVINNHWVYKNILNKEICVNSLIILFSSYSNPEYSQYTLRILKNMRKTLYETLNEYASNASLDAVKHIRNAPNIVLR